jgi:hypothetical protein
MHVVRTVCWQSRYVAAWFAGGECGIVWDGDGRRGG